MKKIPTVFVVDRNTFIASTTPVQDSKWVLDGLGEATIKYDGTPCLIKGNKVYKRWNRPFTKESARKVRYAKKTNQDIVVDESFFKPEPDGAIKCNETFEPKGYSWFYWIPVSKANDDYGFLEAFEALKASNKVADGSYELCAPKVRLNPYGFPTPVMLKHGEEKIVIKDRSYENLRDLLKNLNIEGIVFHHPDGRMAKIRKHDFGFEWNIKADTRAKRNFK